MFIDMWLVSVMFYLSIFGFIFMVIVIYKASHWVGFNGTKLIFDVKDKYFGSR